GLLVDELGHGVVAGLAGQHGGLAVGVGDVQVKDLLVVVQIGALDGVGGGDAVGLVLIVDGQVGQVGLEAPVGRRVHAGGGESALDAQLVLASLDVVGHGLQGVEAGDVVLGVAGSGEQLLVVDDAVR